MGGADGGLDYGVEEVQRLPAVKRSVGYFQQSPMTELKMESSKAYTVLTCAILDA